jgi:hypothetical protein
VITPIPGTEGEIPAGLIGNTAVVLRAGKPGAWGRAAASERDGVGMPGDALVTIGALLDPSAVRERVVGIQAKLHCWATVDRDRCFDDLFKLVADLAFLVMAWTRVRENKGPRPPGSVGPRRRRSRTVSTAWSAS